MTMALLPLSAFAIGFKHHSVDIAGKQIPINKPTVQVLVGKSDATPPKYLQVKGIKKCLKTESKGTWQAWCFPNTKPKGCDATSWKDLGNVPMEKCKVNSY